MKPGKRNLSRFMAVLCPLYCMCEWVESELAARSFWDLLESLIFQSSSSQCASHWHSRRGEETACPPYTPTLPGRFHYYDKPTFPQLVSNEKWKLIWRKKGWLFHREPLPPPPTPLPPNRQDERGDGLRVVHRLRNVRFIPELNSEPVSLLFFTSDGGEL